MNDNGRKTENVQKNRTTHSKSIPFSMVLVAVVSIIAIIVALLTYLYKDTTSFWYDYICGIRGAGWLAFLVGTVILTFKILKHFTDFFDFKKIITPEKFSSNILCILTITIILIVLAMTFLPEEKSENLEPGSSSKYELIRKQQQKNFRFFVALFIMMAGLAVASVPVRRFMRK
jgi:multisubunit Na+/H+ antiporter MnhB subunit